MINRYATLDNWSMPNSLSSWVQTLADPIAQALSSNNHGDLPQWKEILASLPVVPASNPTIQRGMVSFNGNVNQEIQLKTETLLRRLHPWRKGPYLINGIHIDTEWRSDLKWDRLCNHIQPLTGRTVLDVGCGNGYHCWRMAYDGASLVLGVDPYMLSVVQFHAISHFSTLQPVCVLPLGIDDVPQNLSCFDTVFSMGLLYHRKDPCAHIQHLHNCLREEGELVLETLVVNGSDGYVFVPQGRYAKMRNVWSIPSPGTLVTWVEQCGFKNVHLVTVTPVTNEEQRKTDWMTYESLDDFLDPQNNTLTIEGHPAPQRAIVIAQKA